MIDNEFMKALQKRAADAEGALHLLRRDYNWLVDDLQYATDEVKRLGGILPYGWQVPEKV